MYFITERLTSGSLGRIRKLYIWNNLCLNGTHADFRDAFLIDITLTYHNNFSHLNILFFFYCRLQYNLSLNICVIHWNQGLVFGKISDKEETLKDCIAGISKLKGYHGGVFILSKQSISLSNGDFLTKSKRLLFSKNLYKEIFLPILATLNDWKNAIVLFR